MAVRGWPFLFERRFALALRQPILFWILAFTLFISTEVGAELNSGDLNTARIVTEADWLRLQLSVLGLKLSYPAYRIDLKRTKDNVIEFSFIASGRSKNA